MRAKATLAFAMVAALAACTQPPAVETEADAPANEEAAPVVETEPATFVNRVWSVTDRSDGGEAGALYVFMSDGTLVISSPNGQPALGTWRTDGDGLVMVEEGVEYRVDIIDVESDEFQIRSHNPGGSLEIRFERASDEPANRGAGA